MVEEKKQNSNKTRRPYHRNVKNKKQEGEELIIKKEIKENRKIEKLETKKETAKKTNSKRNYSKAQPKFEFKNNSFRWTRGNWKQYDYF